MIGTVYLLFDPSDVIWFSTLVWVNLLTVSPGHIHGNVLDLLLTNIEDIVRSLQVHSNPLLPSGHYDIIFTLASYCSWASFWSKSIAIFLLIEPLQIKGDYSASWQWKLFFAIVCVSGRYVLAKLVTND